MPVDFHPASHQASSRRVRGNQTPFDLLQTCSPVDAAKCEKIFMSSFSDKSADTSFIEACENGFFHSVIQAYNQHHNLVLRPDDVWLAILAQFNIYVNAHSEELRSQFVSHTGERELEVIYKNEAATTLNWTHFIDCIAYLLEKNVNDPELRSWILPDFSTTTEKDRTVCSIVMMSTLQSYFSYKCITKCGIPSVTLLGERADWLKLLERTERLNEFGREPAQWYKLLVPVLSRFVFAFDNPNSRENISFWKKVMSFDGMSGAAYYSGWITAFCFWDVKGSKLYQKSDDSGSDDYHLVKLAPDLFGDREVLDQDDSDKLVLDGVPFHRVEDRDVPPGWTSVPIKVDDDCSLFMARMVAGSVGFRASASGELGLMGKTELDTLQPEAGWWMFRVKEGTERQSEEAQSRDILYFQNSGGRMASSEKRSSSSRES